MIRTIETPIAHIHDPPSVVLLIEALRMLHGPAYDFAVGQWAGKTHLEPQDGRITFRFIIAVEGASVSLQVGDLVRGPSPTGPYRPLDVPFAEVTEPHTEELWPGDVLTVNALAGQQLVLNGRATYFEVCTEHTGYRAPTLVMLRHLSDHPGGCAAYPGAFRREAIPPERPAADAEDRRGTNRVNEHTLDMRIDRRPAPNPHYHGPVPIGGGAAVNHSEMAIVLPRKVYGLPEVGSGDEGHVVIYRRPAEDPADKLLVPVRPGSIVVTPATVARSAGHRFENAFAMLVAIPGFVSPYNFIDE